MTFPFALLLAAIVLLFPFAFRESPLLAQEASPLRVDQADYEAKCIGRKTEGCSYGFTLIARFENQTADTIYLSRCRPRDVTPRYSVETIGDTTEVAAYAKVWACVGHYFPIVAAPWTSRVDTLQLEGPQVYERSSAPIGRLEGTFRLAYWVSRCRSEQPTCQLQLRRSGAFRVHLAR